MKDILIKQLAKIYNLLKSCSFHVQYDAYRRKYDLHPSFKFNGEGITFGGDGEIIIGMGSYIGKFSSLQSAVNAKIEIGNNVSISHNVRIYTTSRDPDQDFTLTKRTFSKSVYIGDGVWIGANVFINPGVRIENGVVIGANSVVTKNLLENGIYGGVLRLGLRLKSLE